MRSIDIKRDHSLTHTQARDLVQAIADDISKQYGASYEWVEDVLRFERSGIKGAVHILPKQVHVRAELGFLMAPLRGMIEAHINQFLDEHAGSGDMETTPGAKGSASKPPKTAKTAAAKAPAKSTTKKPAKKVAKKAVKRVAKE